MEEVKLNDLKITDDNIDDVVNLINVISEKNSMIRVQKYSEAARLRDKERGLIEKFSNKHKIILSDYARPDYEKFTRELKLKNLLNE